MRLKPSLTFADAQAVLAACLDAAAQRSVAISVAVADEAGNLLHFARMDGARAHTIDLASQKARMAAMVGVATGVIAEVHKRYGTAPSPGFPGSGGEPIMFDGQCAGAVGISGATPEIDDAIARDGIGRLAAEVPDL